MKTSIKNIISNGRIFIITAPSGCGKTTVVEALINKLQYQYSLARVVTYTTRKPRTYEINEKDYHFVDTTTFNTLNTRNFFLETTEYNNNFYGSPRAILDDCAKGLSYIFITDLLGIVSLKKLIPNACTILLTVKNIQILKARLLMRNSENALQIKKRLAIAYQEIIASNQMASFFDYIIENNNMRKTITLLTRIIRKTLIT